VPNEWRLGRSFDDWALAAGAGGLWVTNGSSRLTRIEPRDRQVTGIDVRQPLNGVTVAAGAVWAISGQAASVVRLDPRRRTAARPIPIVARRGFESPYPIAIEAGLRSLWVLNGNTATVTRIDPRQRGIAQTIPIGLERAPVRLAVGAGAVWAAGADGTLTRLDPTTNTVTRTAVAHGLNDVAVAGGAVWVSAVPGSGPAQSPPAPAAATAQPSVRALPTSACSPLYYRPGDRPRLLIASDFPLQAPPARRSGSCSAGTGTEPGAIRSPTSPATSRLPRSARTLASGCPTFAPTRATRASSG